MKPGDVIPSNSVIIPADVAKEIATHFRKVNAGPNSRNEKWADLLDPQPPSLREQVAKAWCAEVYGEYSGSARNPAPEHRDAADAVLAVVADRIAAEQEKPSRSWGMEVTPDFYAGLATAESIIRGGAS